MNPALLWRRRVPRVMILPGYQSSEALNCGVRHRLVPWYAEKRIKGAPGDWPTV
jgi:hypothetical protein